MTVVYTPFSNECRHTMGIVEELGETVKQFRAERTNKELEIRVGVFSNGFKAGVAKSVFDQLEQEMNECTTCTTDGRWTEILDYFYCDKFAETIRTRVECDIENIGLLTTHTKKKTLASHIFHSSEDHHTDSCKVVLSNECPIHEVPVAVIPTSVRVKQRKVYNDVREGKTVWRYELSRTWISKSRTSVEHLQHVSEPVHEVEVELVDEGGEYMRTHTDRQVAQSILCKVTMMMGEEADTNIVSFQSETHSSVSKKRPRRGR